MIYFLEQADQALETACGLFPASGTQIYGYAARYGGMFPFCTSWIVQDESGRAAGALGRFHMSLRLSCGVLSKNIFLELMEFLSFLQWDTLEGPADMIQQIAEYKDFSQCTLRLGKTMEHMIGQELPALDCFPVQKNPSLQKLFSILRDSTQDFLNVDEMEWRRDASHLLRHEGGVYAAIDGKALAGVTAVSPQWGFISQVATLPEERGQGFASALTNWCVRFLSNTGRSAVLLCCNPQAERIYQKLGFIEGKKFGVLYRSEFSS